MLLTTVILVGLEIIVHVVAATYINKKISNPTSILSVYICADCNLGGKLFSIVSLKRLTCFSIS